jgi:hypothetical protein
MLDEVAVELALMKSDLVIPPAIVPEICFHDLPPASTIEAGPPRRGPGPRMQPARAP